MALLARRWIWRAGRKLYMWARKDEPNDMSSNGEVRLQRLVIDIAQPGSRMTVFDVGARGGDWSRAFVEAVSGRADDFVLHAFEPMPDSRKDLQKNLAKQVGSGQVRING